MIITSSIEQQPLKSADNNFESISLIPDPTRIMTSLRDTGYNINTAIADIVDNSITAQAKHINITINEDYISIADDGVGMDRAKLINAMKYGSDDSSYQSHSLSKFGLGLKTASTAFCRELNVISTATDSSDVLKAQWDLDYVAQQREWDLRLLEPTNDERQELEQTTHGGSGTLIVWRKIDRLYKSYKRSSTIARHNEDMIRKLRFHLAAVFQRFLDPTDERTTLKTQITLNNIKILPWDPFCTDEPATDHSSHEITIDHPDGSTMSVIIQAYILPKSNEFSSPESEQNARVSNDLQGIYVYRENRLIHYGDWLGLMKNEPHASLCRIEFSFGEEFDELLNVDIKKSRILLIPEIAQELLKICKQPKKQASDRYRNVQSSYLTTLGTNIHRKSNTVLSKTIQEQDNKKHPLIQSTIEQTGTNEVHVTNAKGDFIKQIPIVPSFPDDDMHIRPVNSLEDGILWEPSIDSEGRHVILLNEQHDFYRKVYGYFFGEDKIIQALDMLFWSAGEAEQNHCRNLAEKNDFEDFRYQISIHLSKLISNLPEPNLGEKTSEYMD